MTIPNGMVIPKENFYQAKEWNGGRNAIPFPHFIPLYQAWPKLLVFGNGKRTIWGFNGTKAMRPFGLDKIKFLNQFNRILHNRDSLCLIVRLERVANLQLS